MPFVAESLPLAGLFPGSSEPLATMDPGALPSGPWTCLGMNASFVAGVVIVLVVAWFHYLDIKAAFGPQRMEVRRDGVSLAICILLLLWFFKVTVFEHPEARAGWMAGLLLGAGLGFFDLRRTRVRNTPDGVLVWSSRIVTALFLLAGGLWAATHHGEHRISLEEASENPMAMFFCTTLVAYAIIYIKGLYGVRRFGSAGPSGQPMQSPDRIEYGGRRRGRR